MLRHAILLACILVLTISFAVPLATAGQRQTTPGGSLAPNPPGPAQPYKCDPKTKVCTCSGVTDCFRLKSLGICKDGVMSCTQTGCTCDKG